MSPDRLHLGIAFAFYTPSEARRQPGCLDNCTETLLLPWWESGLSNWFLWQLVFSFRIWGVFTWRQLARGWLAKNSTRAGQMEVRYCLELSVSAELRWAREEELGRLLPVDNRVGKVWKDWKLLAMARWISRSLWGGWEGERKKKRLIWHCSCD